MENLKQQLLEHIAELLNDKEFELDMILQNCKDPELPHKSNLHLLMADASFKVFCEYFNKQDKTKQCIINGVGLQSEQLTTKLVRMEGHEDSCKCNDCDLLAKVFDVVN